MHKKRTKYYNKHFTFTIKQEMFATKQSTMNKFFILRTHTYIHTEKQAQYATIKYAQGEGTYFN